jgi:hypothetical protein
LNGIQPIEFFWFGKFLYLSELGSECPSNSGGYERTDFLEAVILVPHILEQFRRRPAFVPRETEFHL